MPHFQDVIERQRLADHLKRAAAAHHEYEQGEFLNRLFLHALGSGKIEAFTPKTADEKREILAEAGIATTDPDWATWYANWMVDHACDKPAPTVQYMPVIR